MPNIFNKNGLQLKTSQEYIQGYEDALKSIFGSDVLVSPETPDGQDINIRTQANLDTGNLIASVNAGFDPDQAEGVVLDQRVAINGIKRKSGTYTYVNITITTDRALTIQGLNNEGVDNAYTVRDAGGVEYVLVDTYIFSGADVQSLEFRAKEIGSIIPIPNTLTIPVTVIVGVLTVNNPNQPTVAGIDGETDSELRKRREETIEKPSENSLQSISASLGDVDDVVAYRVLDNPTNATDSFGVPAHNLWTIVQGGADDVVADIIYNNKPPGIPMYGAESVNLPNPQGGIITISFDRPILTTLYLRFDLDDRTAGNLVDEQGLRDAIVLKNIYNLGETVDVADITASIVPLVPKFYVLNVEISRDNITYVTTKIDPVSPQERFLLNNGQDGGSVYYIQINVI